VYTVDRMTTSRFALLLALAGCGGDGLALDRDEVTSIPDGSGTGTAASGHWIGTLTTTSCSGRCLVSGFSLCDVGELDDYELDTVQTDGHLLLESDDLATPSMNGGIDADGSFRVGGYATELGGMVELLSETTGQVTGDTFTGTVIASSEGSYEDEAFACNVEYTTRGERTDD
jgi:hypothetical protein